MNDANVSEVGPELERIVEAARDSVNDDIVGRLAGLTTEALDTLDRFNRSGLSNAIPTLAEMANNGDLERLAGLARLYTTAEDAVNDDIVGRLAETAGNGMALLDKVNRSGLEQAIPVLSKMIENGDLERVAQLARLIPAAEDAMTDDMIGRLADTLGGALVLADQASRSRIGEALPILDEMVGNGDLRRLSELARLIGAAEDALNDDMVGRLAEMAGEAASVVDRLNRSGVGRLVEVLEKLDASGGLDVIAETLPKATKQLSVLADIGVCLEDASREVKSSPSTRGGLLALMNLMRDKDNLDFLRFVMAFGRRLKERCFSRV